MNGTQNGNVHELQRETHNNKHERRVQKINSFNKIHVKHQNTEMAKKEKKSFVSFFLILYKSQWFKNITNF